MLAASRDHARRGGRAPQAGAGPGRGSRPVGGQSRTSCCRSWRASRRASATSRRSSRPSEDQLKRLEAASKALEQRRTQLAFSEKRIAAFEARAAELAQLTEEIDAKIADSAQREAVVEAVRKEVAGVHEVSARSKSDLQYVEAHRNDVAALRERVDEVLACVGETETRLAQIESRKKLVDEVQLKTSVITNMLEDVRLNLETLGEQKAVVDHVMDDVIAPDRAGAGGADDAAVAAGRARAGRAHRARHQAAAQDAPRRTEKRRLA